MLKNEYRQRQTQVLGNSPGQDRQWATRSFRLALAIFSALLLWCMMYDNGFPFDLMTEHKGALIQSPNTKNSPSSSSNQLGNIFDSLSPSKELHWTPCYDIRDSYLCARLIVPLDYRQAVTGRGDCHQTVELALIMLPGKGRGGYSFNKGITSANFSVSPLLVNPGGPGGSGVEFVLGFGKAIQLVVGEDQDIVGFDPRGVGLSTPRSDCFLRGRRCHGKDKTSADEQDALMRRVMSDGLNHDLSLVNSSNVALNNINAANRALNQLCSSKDVDEGEHDILRYVGTPTVARDLLSIIHAWDSWQGFEVPVRDTKSSVVPTEFTSQHNSTRGKLVYWGFSYGTLLGATFSAMFPDKVGRIVLDGVLDADHYVRPTWYDSLMDADAIWDAFFEYCLEAGPKCAFYRGGNNKHDLKNRYEALETSLKKNPLTLVTPDRLTVVITFSVLRRAVFSALYSPVVTFPNLAKILIGLEQGQPAFPVVRLPTRNGCLVRPQQYPHDGRRAIMCGDKRYPMNYNISELQLAFEKVAQTSRFADVWMTLMLECSHYNITSSDPPMRWGNDDQGTEAVLTSTSSSSSSLPSPSCATVPKILSTDTSSKIVTSFPLLLLTNTYDPVTPKHAALKMSDKFVGARLVEQTTLGHCTLVALTACTIAHVRAYFRDGQLPPPTNVRGGKWTVCHDNDGDNSNPWLRAPSADSSDDLSFVAAQLRSLLSDSATPVLPYGLQDHSSAAAAFLDELLLPRTWSQ